MPKEVLIINNGNALDYKKFDKKTIIVRWSDSQSKVPQDEISLTEYIENNSLKIRKNYIIIIKDLLKIKLKNCNFSEIFKINEKISFLEMSNILHKDNLHKSIYINSVLKLIAIEEIIAGMNIKEIISLENNYEINQILKSFSRKNKLKFILISSKRKYIKEFFNSFLVYRIFISFAKANLWLLREFFLSLIFINPQELENQIRNVFISYIGDNNIKDQNQFFNKNQYWGNLPNKLLKNKSNSLFVHIFLNKNNPFKLKKFIKNINFKNSTQTHVILNSFLKPKYFIKIIYYYYSTIKKNLFVDFDNLKLNKKFDYLLLFRNDFYHDLYGLGLVKNLVNYYTLIELHKNLNPKSNVFYLMENQPWEIMLLKIREEMSFLNSFGFVHVPIRFWDLRYLFNFELESVDSFSMIFPKNILVGDNITRKYLESFKSIRNKIMNVEALRFLDVKKNNKLNNYKFSGKKKLNILIFTDYRENSTKKQIEIIFNSNVFKENKYNFEVTIKEHPAKRGYVQRITDASVLLSELDASELIEKNDYIFAPSASSVAVNLYYSNKRYFLFDDKSSLNLNIFMGFNSINTFNSSKEIDEKFEIQSSQNNIERNHDLFTLSKNLDLWMGILNNGS